MSNSNQPAAYKVHVMVISSEYLSDEPVVVKRRLMRDIHTTKLSTAETINVVRYGGDPSQYLIAVDGRTLGDILPSVLVSNIINTFNSIDESINVDFVLGFISTESGLLFRSINEAKYTLMIHNVYTSLLKDSPRFNYSTSECVSDLFERYTRTFAHLCKYSNQEKHVEPEDSHDEDDEIVGDIDGFVDMLSGYDDDEHSKKRKKKKRVKYNTSKVIKASNKPKRSYRRHGIIICKEKNAIKKDKKIIKDFLKDFIPGNSGWKKDLREDLLNRWMRVYVISSKQIHRIQREYTQSMKCNKRKAEIQSTIDATRKLFNVPLDRWNDQTR